MPASQTPTQAVQTAPSPPEPTEAEKPVENAAAPQPQIIVQMVENKAAEPTQGLSDIAEGGKFKHNGKTYDAFLREIK